MKASKFSDAEKAFILKQGAGGMPVTEVRRTAENFNRQTDDVSDFRVSSNLFRISDAGCR
jgi:hypothetical protein